MSFLSSLSQGVLVQVLDEKHRPLRTAQVLVKKTEKRTNVTPDGAFFKSLCAPGEYHLEVSQFLPF